jgi:glycerol-3-phosphate acyltransferase PlsX
MSKIGYFLARHAFAALKAKMDPRNVNGGVFLGLNGVVIKSHGASDAVGTAHAVEIGYAMARHELLRRISDALPLSRAQFPAQSRLRAAGAPVAAPSGS